MHRLNMHFKHHYDNVSRKSILDVVNLRSKHISRRMVFFVQSEYRRIWNLGVCLDYNSTTHQTLTQQINSTKLYEAKSSDFIIV